MYLYKTVTYHDTSGVASVPASNAADNADFVANRKASAVQVDALELAETVFVTEKSYTDFGTLVTNNTTWASVKYVTGAKSYEMYLISNTPLS